MCENVNENPAMALMVVQMECLMIQRDEYNPLTMEYKSLDKYIVIYKKAINTLLKKEVYSI